MGVVRVVLGHTLPVHRTQASAVVGLLRAELTVDVLDGLALDGRGRRYRMRYRFGHGDDAFAMQHRVSDVLIGRADQILAVMTRGRGGVLVRSVRNVDRCLRVDETTGKTIAGA